MSTQQSDRANGGAEIFGGDAGAPNNAGSQASASGTQAGANPPNPGSARSDYGDLAYGGRLDREGLEEGAPSHYGERADSRGFSKARARSVGSGGGLGSAWLLLAGIGAGAALMYMLDPDKGGRRRALVRDKLVAFTNDAADAIASKSRHLRNRAQGVIAEAGSLLKSGNQGQSAGESQQNQPAPGQ